MDEHEYTDLLAYLREQVLEAGRADLDDDFALDLLESDEATGREGSSYATLLRYLDMLIVQLRLEDARAARRVLAKLNELEANVEPITRFVLDVEPGVLSTSEVDLMEASDLASVILTLEDVRVELAESRRG